MIIKVFGRRCALVVVAIGAGWSLSAVAQYRCNVNGEVVYQAQRCQPLGASPSEPMGVKLFIASDPGADYFVLQASNIPGGKLQTITTKRTSRSATSYSRREFDCASSKVRYLGTGQTYEAMLNSKPDAALSLIVTGSIADVVSSVACKAYLQY